ncbi:MAG: Plug domain-containing protein, partial [Bacteroidota bacterium]
MKKILSLLLLTLIGVVANAQQAIQRGRVTRDASQNQSTTSSTSLAKIKIRLSDDSQIGLTDSAGYFSPSETLFSGDLIFGYRNGEKLFGYKWQDQTDGNNNTPNQGIDLQIIIIGNGLDLMGEVRIRISQGGPFLEEIKPQKLQLNPSMGNGIESLIKTFIGASSGNEMSSQYTVRGGNYDENLIYVNDIEILRPQLISSGQQEGLSFINSDLVQSVKFSAGGFGAQYGDKMSSVLDVDYIRPDSFKGSATVGTMLSSATISGKKNRFSGFLGIRNFNNSLLTKTLNVKGNYSMRFNDLQTQVTYKLNRKLFIDFLGNLASNNYTLNPISRSTTFGTIQNAYQLDVGMGGQESLKYLYGMGSLTLRYTPNIRNEFKWMLNHTSIE